MPTLSGRKVLVIEDEYFIADDLVQQLAGAGAAIVGPASTVEAALALLNEGVDLAILDINLKGRMSFALADELALRDIPFVFATGYDAAMIPALHAHRRRWQKPFDVAQLIATLDS